MTNNNKKHETLTKCSSNKGFNGNSSILPRSKFCVTGQESSSQSLTAATLGRYLQGGGDNSTITFSADI